MTMLSRRAALTLAPALHHLDRLFVEEGEELATLLQASPGGRTGADRRVEAMTNAIEVSDLVKTFGRTRALDGLDLSVATGEVHGFLGPNGSGKSTTIRVLLGLLRADSGRAVLLGGNLSGGEVIDLLGHLRGGLDRRRRDELLERFELDPTKQGRTYSRATARRWRWWPGSPPTPSS